MKHIFRPATLLSVALFSLVLVIVFARFEPLTTSPYFFEVKLATSLGGRSQVYYDTGEGFAERFSAWQTISRSTELKLYRWPLPSGIYRALRFDPIDTSGTVTIADARVMRHDGTTILAFTPENFFVQNQIASLKPAGNGVSLITTSGANDPYLGLTLPAPFTLEFTQPPIAREVIRKFIVVFIAFLALFALTAKLKAQPAAARTFQRVREYFHARPQHAVAVVSLVAAVTSCYPVAFLGRSYVSPNVGATLLYPRFPTLPGYSDSSTEDLRGTDFGALMWGHVPMSMVQHRALFRDQELPLWLRDNSCGAVLLGQGQTMAGEPLHLLPVLANGAAWAWDLKFIIARWLFAYGLGLTVLAATRHTPAALITALSGAFIGFFIYRANHPAYFSLCYSPWILYAWVQIANAADWRRAAKWIGLLILANHCELTSGTAKEAYMLLICLQLTGFLMLIFSSVAWRVTIVKAAAAGIGLVLFVMIASPVWVTFLEAMRHGYTVYDSPNAYQIQPALLLGLFDEVFYRPIEAQQLMLNPSVNFLVLAGVIYRLATLRRAPPGRIEFALLLSAIIPLSLAFGLVPPQWIIQVPFLGNVSHIDNTFSCVLMIHLFAIAGFGYKSAAERLGQSEGRGDLLVSAMLLAALLFPYIALTHTVHRSPFGAGLTRTFLTWGQQLPVSQFTWGYLASLLGGTVVLAASIRTALRRRSMTPALLIMMGTCVLVMLWRHGAHARFGFDDYVLNPAVRVDFHATSAAVEFVKASDELPARVVGFGACMFPGWTAAYDLEGIGGPDAVHNRQYRELLEALGLRQAWSWLYPLELDQLDHDRRIYDFLNVRFYFDAFDRAAQIEPRLERKTHADLDVYTSATAWPRAFFTDRVFVYDKPADLAQFVHSSENRPFAAMQASDQNAIPQLVTDISDRIAVAATNYHLSSNTTEFTIDAPAPGLIVLHEAWWPDDFRVTVNGTRATYLRVNHAFKGIYVDAPGTYQIKFAYWPRTLTLTLACAVTALIVVIGVGTWLCVQSRRTGSITSAPPRTD